MSYDIQDFQHPDDSSKAKDIFLNSATKTVLDKLKQLNIENIYSYLYAASCPQLTKKNLPELYENLSRACEMFGLEKIPKVLVTRNYREMVSVCGVNEPFIVFSSTYLKKLSPEMLFGILAGQVAAIRCEHHKLLYIMWGFQFFSSQIPGVSFVVEPLVNSWKRCRFFTYDRAFALATKNYPLSLKQILINVVPKIILDKMKFGTNQDDFAEQVENFLYGMDKTQTGVKQITQWISEKDWLPVRYAEVKKFFDEKELCDYEKLYSR